MSVTDPSYDLARRKSYRLRLRGVAGSTGSVALAIGNA